MGAQVVSRELAEKMLVDKATSDAAFRAALLSDPKSAIRSALGVTLPPDLAITVIEETPRSVVLVLPARGDGALSDADLRDIVGGATKQDKSDDAGKSAFQNFIFGTSIGSKADDPNTA